MARALGIDENDLSQIKILATEAFALGQDYEALKANLNREFSEKLSQLVAGFKKGTAFVTNGPPVDLESMRDGARLVKASGAFCTAPVAALAMHQPTSAGQPASGSWTSLKETFLKDKPGITQKTLWSYNQAFDAWEGLIGAKPISDIRRADVKTYADFLRDRRSLRGGGLNHKSIVRSLGHIKTFMAWAVKAGLLYQSD